MIAKEISARKLIPLAAAFGAIYGTLRTVPFSVFIGPTGRVLTTSEFVAPLLGIILGPYAGSLAAIVGTFVGILVTGRMNFFGLDFLAPTMNALILGFLIRKKQIVSILFYSALLVLFFAHPSTLHFVSVTLPNGSFEVPFAWLHIVAWLLLVSPLGSRIPDWVSGGNAWKAVAGACLLAFIGTTSQQLTGSLLFASMAVPLMGMTPESLQSTWLVVFYVYPIERFIVSLAATMIIVAVVKALRVSGLLQGWLAK